MKKRNEFRGRLAFAARLILAVSLLCAYLSGLTVPAVGAESGEGIPESFGELTELLPEEVGELLPEGIDSEDTEEVGNALAALTSPDELFRLIGRISGVELGESVRLLAKLCALLVIAAVFGAIQRTLGSSALAGMARFCTTTAVFAAIIYTQMEHLRSVVSFFERLTSLMGAMIPITGTVWAMGGNVSTATAGTGTLYVFVTVCETLCAKTVMPLCCFLTALALCNALSPETGMRGLASATKKTYTFLMGMTMTLLLACLSSQTTLTAAADSTTARAAKTVSATVIPMVGGSVGETLRTVASGVQYLKSVVGVGGILFVFLLTLPTLVSLILTRLVFLLCGGVADLLGCEGESRLLSELGTIWGCMIAAVAMSSVMFILALTIFVRTTVAIL